MPMHIYVPTSMHMRCAAVYPVWIPNICFAAALGRRWLAATRVPPVLQKDDDAAPLTPPRREPPSTSVQDSIAADSPVGVSTSGQDVSTSGQDVSTSGQDVSTSGQNVSTSGQDVSTSGQDVSTSGQDPELTDLGIELVSTPRSRCAMDICHRTCGTDSAWACASTCV